MITTSHFQPAWPLRNQHTQTLWPFLFRRQIAVAYTPERLDLPDGDFVDVFWCGDHFSRKMINANDLQRPIVVMLHGLGGCFESHYVKGMVIALQNNGYRVVFLHARGCSGESNRLPRTFHAADTSELDFVVKTVNQRYPKAALAVLGFSLGGSILLKWLGTMNTVSAAVAVSVPFNLADTANALNRGFARVYQNHLLRRLKFLLANQVRAGHLHIAQNQLRNISTLFAYDDAITARINGFKNAAHYYRIASCQQYLAHIQNPTLIVNAVDDPFVPKRNLPNNKALAPEVMLELSDAGGHVGFLQSSPSGVKRYLEVRVPQFFNRYCR